MNESDDIDVRDAVRTAGSDAPPQFRATMRDSLDAALRGERMVTVAAPPSTPHRARWLAIAAAVLVIGVVAAVLAFSGDERGTLTPVTVPSTLAPTTVVPTTAAPTTVAPTTVVPTTIAITEPTAPLPDPDIPLLSVDATMPTAIVSTPLVTKRFTRTPTSLNYAVFQDDGWTVHEQSANGAPVRLTHYSLDGRLAWAVEAPGVLGVASQSAQPVLGPFGVLYLYYEASQDYQVAAVPTSGPRAGEVVATWAVAYSCYETYCGPPMTPTGLGLPDGTTAPYVDTSGRPTTATFESPEVAQLSDALGPAMPTDWVTFDDFGNAITSTRTTMTRGSVSWTFDALGVMVAGDFHYLSQRVLDDGGLLVWFSTSDQAGANPPNRTQFIGRLQPDGSSSFWEVPTNVLDVAGKDGRIYVTTYDDATETYTLAELVTG